MAQRHAGKVTDSRDRLRLTDKNLSHQYLLRFVRSNRPYTLGTQGGEMTDE